MLPSYPAEAKKSNLPLSKTSIKPPFRLSSCWTGPSSSVEVKGFPLFLLSWGSRSSLQGAAMSPPKKWWPLEATNQTSTKGFEPCTLKEWEITLIPKKLNKTAKTCNDTELEAFYILIYHLSVFLTAHKSQTSKHTPNQITKKKGPAARRSHPVRDARRKCCGASTCCLVVRPTGRTSGKDRLSQFQDLDPCPKKHPTTRKKQMQIK